MGRTRSKKRVMFQTTLDKQRVLHVDPHYTDRRFKEAQSIFGAENDEIFYAYSDRLVDWDCAKSDASWSIARASGATPKTCEFFEKYLSAYFDRLIVIDHIVAGVNVATGYPYLVFGYRDMLQD